MRRRRSRLRCLHAALPARGYLVSNPRAALPQVSEIMTRDVVSLLPEQEILDAIGPARRIAVLDRNHSPGSGGIFWQELAATLRDRPDIILQDYLVGLGGGDVTPEIINEIVDDLAGRSAASDPVWKEIAA